jgi:hypothetical protein
MNAYEQQTTMNKLIKHEWSHAITIHALDPTLGGLYLSITDAFTKLQTKYPDIEYWVVASIGSINENPHYHGVVKMHEELSKKELKRNFKGCTSPTIKNLYDKERWLDYVLKQGLSETTITTMEKEQ